MIGASLARSVTCLASWASKNEGKQWANTPTLAFTSPPVYARAGYKYVMYDRKYTLAANPSAVLTSDLTVIKHGGLV